jgi:hypothetical protein
LLRPPARRRCLACTTAPQEHPRNTPRTRPEHCQNSPKTQSEHPPPNSQVSVPGEHIGVSVPGVHIWRAAMISELRDWRPGLMRPVLLNGDSGGMSRQASSAIFILQQSSAVSGDISRQAFSSPQTPNNQPTNQPPPSPGPFRYPIRYPHT